MLIDTHCHLDFPDFAPELPETIARAKARGVARMITISTHLSRFDQVKSIALQRWHGAPDSGRWMHQTNLTIPSTAKMAPQRLSA